MNGSISNKTTGTNNFAPRYGNRKRDALLEKFAEECNSNNIMIIEEELSELEAYLNFLSRHVTAGKGCSVSCMMLWSEWAKFCKSQTRNYPRLILEKEFRFLILHQFNLHTGENISSGVIYPGLQFVSNKKRMVENAAHPSSSAKIRAIICG
jgi:hypothetical protein